MLFKYHKNVSGYKTCFFVIEGNIYLSTNVVEKICAKINKKEINKKEIFPGFFELKPLSNNLLK